MQAELTNTELGAALREHAYLEGDFVLRSGRRSRYYLDKYRFETRPDLLAALGERIAESVREHEPDGRLRLRCRRDQTLAVSDDEDAPGLEGDFELRELTGSIGLVAPLLGLGQQRFGLVRDLLRTPLVRERRADHLAAALEDDGGTNLRGDLPQALEGGGSVHGLTLTLRRRLRCRPKRPCRPVRHGR